MTSRKINCPRCKKETVYGPENPFRPFCSERCRLIDLGQWANETYKVPSKDTGSVQELAEALEEVSQSSEDDSRRASEESNKKN